MKPQHKSVCLIAGGIVEENLRLQPWRYLSEVGRGLTAQGHKVTILSDGTSADPECELLAGVSIMRMSSVRNPFWRRNALLQSAIARLAPDVILWHVGLVSFLHQRLKGPSDTPIIGVFTSPIYGVKDFTHLGIGKIVSGFSLATLHILGSLVPRRLFRYLLVKNKPLSLVVQTETTRIQLVEQGLWLGDIQVIPPGVDEIWRQPSRTGHDDFREVLEYKPDDVVIVYFGSPAPLRGLPALVEAFTIARGSDSALKLLILSRRRPGELQQECAALERLVSASQFSHHIQIIAGYQDIEDLIRYVGAGDIVALPFELVPSDAPLSLLEAGAFGMPVVSTRVACLPELVSNVEHYIAEPADPVSLSHTLLQAVHFLRQREITRVNSIARSWREMTVEWSQLIKNI